MTEVSPAFRVKKAVAAEIPAYLEICAQAKEKMRSSGNMLQWEGNYPSSEIIASDISSGCGYAVFIGDRPVVYFCLLDRPEPTYSKIYGGRWLDDSLPYGTIHRIASIHGIHGAARFVFDWCGELAGNIRIDTHRDNVIMRHILEKEGFVYCGIIYLANGDERLAYQKIYNQHH